MEDSIEIDESTTTMKDSIEIDEIDESTIRQIDESTIRQNDESAIRQIDESAKVDSDNIEHSDESVLAQVESALAQAKSALSQRRETIEKSENIQKDNESIPGDACSPASIDNTQNNIEITSHNNVDSSPGFDAAISELDGVSSSPLPRDSTFQPYLTSTAKRQAKMCNMKGFNCSLDKIDDCLEAIINDTSGDNNPLLITSTDFTHNDNDTLPNTNHHTVFNANTSKLVSSVKAAIIPNMLEELQKIERNIIHTLESRITSFMSSEREDKYSMQLAKTSDRIKDLEKKNESLSKEIKLEKKKFGDIQKEKDNMELANEDLQNKVNDLQSKLTTLSDLAENQKRREERETMQAIEAMKKDKAVCEKEQHRRETILFNGISHPLSNHYLHDWCNKSCKIKYHGKYFPTAEHAWGWYMAHFHGLDELASQILDQDTPQKVLVLFKKIDKSEKWLAMEENEMLILQLAKYNDCDGFQRYLLENDGCELIENTRNKKWGGIPKFSGENKLGKCLMNFRDVVIKDTSMKNELSDQNCRPFLQDNLKDSRGKSSTTKPSDVREPTAPTKNTSLNKSPANAEVLIIGNPVGLRAWDNDTQIIPLSNESVTGALKLMSNLESMPKVEHVIFPILDSSIANKCVNEIVPDIRELVSITTKKAPQAHISFVAPQPRYFKTEDEAKRYAIKSKGVAINLRKMNDINIINIPPGAGIGMYSRAIKSWLQQNPNTTVTLKNRYDALMAPPAQNSVAEDFNHGKLMNLLDHLKTLI